ncbi:hypothetical protein TWF718_001985 [Orbilia javanica]|uniref:Uncharacterized protein n=1 Tax=Orbilia javanica TaxID=47235 RepID=A0AAN8N9D5_9PEZI
MALPPSTVQGVALGFEILMMPYDPMKSLASIQSAVAGDNTTGVIDDTIFLEIEVPGQDETRRGKERPSLSITFPANDVFVGCLKYTELKKCIAYYRLGDGEECASVWLLSTELPQLSVKVRNGGSLWSGVRPCPEANAPGRRDCLYMRCSQGIRIDPNFFAKCQMGYLICSDLAPGMQVRDSFDPTGALREGIIANDFLARFDSEVLVTMLRDPNRKRKKNATHPPALAPESVPEQPVQREPPGGGVETSLTENSNPKGQGMEPCSKTPAPGLHILDDVHTMPLGCPALAPLSTTSISEAKASTSGRLIDFEDEFIGAQKFDRTSWVNILAEQMLPLNVEDGKKKPASGPACWLDILKEEFKEGSYEGSA